MDDDITLLSATKGIFGLSPSRRMKESDKEKENRKLRQKLESLKRKTAKIQEKLDRHMKDDATMSGGLMESEDDNDA